MFYLCYMYVLTNTGVLHDFHIKWCSCRLTVTRRVSHLEQELLTRPEHLSSPPVFNEVRVARSLFSVYCFVDCCLSFCSFSLWHSPM